MDKNNKSILIGKPVPFRPDKYIGLGLTLIKSMKTFADVCQEL